jgi:hypothetical protein
MPSPYFKINDADVGIWIGEDGAQGGIVETWTDQGLEVTVYLHCAWFDRAKVYSGLRGTVGWGSGPIGLAAGGTIQRTDPAVLPVPPNSAYRWDRMVCVGTGEVRGEKWRTDPDGSITGVAGWGFYVNAIIPARFAVTPWQTIGNIGDGSGSADPADRNDISGQPYTITKIRTQGEVLCPPHGTYFWPNGNAVDESHIGIIRAKQEISITRVYMPSVHVAEIQSCIGTINGKPLRIGDYTFPKGSLMMAGCESEPYGDVGIGLLAHDIHITLLGNGLDNKPPDGNDHIQDFNYIMSPDGTYQKIADKQGNTPFPYVNMWYNIWPEFYQKGN